jgi:hypothetical protein
MPRQQTLAAPHGGRHATLSDNQGLDNQAMLNSLAEKEDPFADTPWIADELRLAVRGVLGCGDVEDA